MGRRERGYPEESEECASSFFCFLPFSPVFTTLIMRFNAIIALTVSLVAAGPAAAINIISSNDDGWAEVNIRALFDALTSAGHTTVVSAPAENESGTGW